MKTAFHKENLMWVERNFTGYSYFLFDLDGREIALHEPDAISLARRVLWFWVRRHIPISRGRLFSKNP